MFFKYFGPDQIRQLAENTSRFFTFLGVQESSEKAGLEELFVNRFVEDIQNKPSIVYSSGTFYYYRNRNIDETYSVSLNEENHLVVHFDGKKIKTLDGDAFVNR